MDLSFTTIPPSAAHTHTVVFLHGRGDTAQNFASSLDYSTDSSDRSLLELFPSFRWVFPQAETRQCAAWPGDKMPQWFDKWNIRDFSEREQLQTACLRESVAGIRRILANDAADLDGKCDVIVFGGNSQGSGTR